MKLFRTACVLFLFLVLSLKTYSQGLNNLWLLGYDSIFMVTTGKTNIDFSSGTASISWVNRPMNLYASSASICNKNGDLLFYTNGVYIANSTNDTMLNGSGLNPSAYTTQSQQQWDGLSITQSDIVIPFPSDTSKYYLFHVTIDTLNYIPLYLYYTIIDMTLDSGRGGVVSKNNVLFNHAIGFGGLTACKHGNGRDWWLVCHEFNSNQYYKFLVTSYGIQGPFGQSIGKIMDFFGGGQVMFSPDGSRFANYDGYEGLDIMDFDRCTGIFSNKMHVSIDTSYLGGVTFSSNSKVLYVTANTIIYQYNLDTTNIIASEKIVAVWDSFASPSPPFYTTFYLSQLAPDGKIYIATGNGTDKMHVINYPDSLGLACDVQQHSVNLPTYNGITIPNYPNYFLGRLVGSMCDTLTAVTNLEPGLNDVNVFPNPATRLLYVQWRTTKNNLRKAELHVYNTMGQLMDTPFSILKDEYVEVNVSQLPTGIYFVELLTEQEKVVKRFVKY